MHRVHIARTRALVPPMFTSYSLSRVLDLAALAVVAANLKSAGVVLQANTGLALDSHHPAVTETVQLVITEAAAAKRRVTATVRFCTRMR